ncbi:hypothetical protein BH10BAC4_BH10BAC4_02540 [soil metagenome]
MVRPLRWIIYGIAAVAVVMVLSYAAALFYRPAILRTLNRELNKSVNGDVKIGYLNFTFFEDFPNFSVAIGKIYLRGPQYGKYNKDFFTADVIYTHVNPLALFLGEINLKSIIVKNGNIFIFRTSQGYTNLDVFRKQNQDSVKDGSGPSIDLENIRFEDSRFIYVDSLKRKSYDVGFISTNVDISSSDSSKFISLDGKMLFGGVTFNIESGGYVANTRTDAKLNIEVNSQKNQLIIHPSELEFAKSKVNLEGNFDLGPPGLFTLNIVAKDLNYKEGLTLVTRKLGEKLSKFQFDGPIDLAVRLHSLQPVGEPQVDIAYSSKGNHFTTGKLELKDFSFNGTFTNHIDSLKPIDDLNSRLVLDTVIAKLSEVHINAKLSITDLKVPKLDLDSKSLLNLIDFNYETDTTRLKMLGGTITTNVKYSGLLDEYLDSDHTVYHGKLKGDLQVNNASMNMVVQKKKFEKVNARLHFTEKRMDIDKIDLIVNGNEFHLQGNVTGFIPFFFLPEKKGIVNLTVHSPHIDLATMINKNKLVKAVPVSKKENRKRISDLLDVLNHKVDFVLNLKIDELVNGPFNGTNFLGKVTLSENELTASPVTMNMADGEVSFSFKMSDLEKEINPVILNAEVKDADIKKFFSTFNDFSQKTIQSSNLSGKVFAKMSLTTKIDDQFNVLMPSLVGEVDFKLKEGELKDFAPLEKMSNFLLKKRDFTSVQFAEIKGEFRISGQYLDVSRMEIESSILTLFLEGRYSLGDSTDLSIQVPLSNLRRRNKDYKPENVGVDAKVGPSVFLRAHQNKDGQMVIVYNMFKKFKKK